MTTTTFEAMAARKNQLILKALEGSIWIAPYTATAITSITSGSAADLQTLPTGYQPIGWCGEKTGATWTRKPDTSDVRSWGSVTPTRRDITKDERSVHFMAQETKALTLEMYEGVNLSAVKSDATSGEVKFDAPSRPVTKYYKLFGLFVDGVGADQIYVGRYCPRVSIEDFDDQTWAVGDDPVAYDMTLACNYDPTEGTAMRFFFGGPGWKAFSATDTGFPVGP